MAAFRPTALITGASAGIGEALAHQFARGGYDLILVARNPQKLEESARKIEALGVGARTHTISIDLRAPEAGAKLQEEVASRGLVVDVLVNNAGIAYSGAFTQVSLEEQMATVDLDVRIVTELTRRFLPGMIQRGDAGILNVSSMAGYQPGPYAAVYCAAKAYVLWLTEALNYELKGTGVHATALCPGPVQTGFFDKGRFDHSILLKKALPVLTPEKVAEIGYRGFQRRRREIIPGAMVWAFAKSGAFTPRPLLLAIVDLLTKTKGSRGPLVGAADPVS